VTAHVRGVNVWRWQPTSTQQFVERSPEATWVRLVGVDTFGPVRALFSPEKIEVRATLSAPRGGGRRCGG